MASPAQSTPRGPQSPPPAQPTLQDELLEEIFLRLPTAADLARACMACVSFRRIITDHRFLRSFRTLHPPPLLGIISSTFRPAQPPHPSAAAASTFANADAADFSCSFLPSIEQWSRRDFRDGRTLLASVSEESDFAVCDPLYRRYRRLPSIPNDLRALVHQAVIVDFQSFFAPPSEDEDDMAFRVMSLAQCTTKLVLFIFSSGVGQWHAVTFDGWITLMSGPDNPALGFELSWASGRFYVHRCFCWAINPTNKLLVLDTQMMQFSAANLPPPLDPGRMFTNLAFGETGEGIFGMFILHADEYGVYEIRYTMLRKDGDGTNQWQSVAIIPLPIDYHYTIMGVAGGYLLLQGIPLPERPDVDCFSLNLQTLQLEWFCGNPNRYPIVLADLYAGFPPSLSPPTV